MKNIPYLLICLLLSTSAIADDAAAPTSLNLLQVFELAQKNDNTILAAEFTYQASRQALPQARAALLPNIELDVFASRNDTEVTDQATNITSSSRYDANGYKLALTQSLYNHGLWMLYQQADLSVTIAEARINAARQDLMVRSAQVYYSLLAAQDNLRFATAEKAAIGKQLEQNQQRFEVGLIAITDVKESQAQYDLSVAQWIAAENAEATARENVRSMIGVVPDKLAALSTDIPLLLPEPANLEAWIKTAEQNNLANKAAQLSYAVAQKEVGVQRSGHYPSLSLIAQRENTTTDGLLISDNETTTDSIMINLNVPIFAGGLISARSREAVALKEQLRVLRDQAQRDTEQLCRNSYFGVTTAIARVNAFKQALISTHAAYAATQAGYEVGTRTAIDVLVALREQYRAERDYAQSRYDYVLNVLRLKQAAGMLLREDVVQVNLWLVN